MVAVPNEVTQDSSFSNKLSNFHRPGPRLLLATLKYNKTDGAVKVFILVLDIFCIKVFATKEKSILDLIFSAVDS